MSYDPPTLREVLNRGDDLADHVSVEYFANKVLVEARMRAPRAFRDDTQEDLEDFIAEPLHGGPRSREMRAEYAWTLELCDNRDLLSRVRAVFPAELVAKCDRHAELMTHSYPLQVRTPDGDWSCECCGALFDDGDAEALTIDNLPQDPEGVRAHDLPHPLRYCRGCVGTALSAFSEQWSVN